MKLPSFNLSAVFTLRDRLIESVFAPRYNESLAGECFDAFVDDLARQLPGAIARAAIFETARQVLDVELTPAVCSKLAWRLAGNLPRLRQGRPVVPWLGQVEDEWVPLQITSVHPGRSKTNELGSWVKLRVLAGTPCPQIVDRFMGRRFAFALSRRLGFSNRRGDFRYEDPKQLVNLRMLGKIEADKSREKPRFGPVECPGSLLEHNRCILRVRVRLDPCPRGWHHPCHRCVIGYVSCGAATHRLDYEKRFCDKCGQESYFDPASQSGHCVQCDEKESTRRHL